MERGKRGIREGEWKGEANNIRGVRWGKMCVCVCVCVIMYMVLVSYQ